MTVKSLLALVGRAAASVVFSATTLPTSSEKNEIFLRIFFIF